VMVMAMVIAIAMVIITMIAIMIMTILALSISHRQGKREDYPPGSTQIPHVHAPVRATGSQQIGASCM
jgi:hypothetical protein